ncbi:hypothetical protein HPULCUR_001628 [Helicostylum pulchrum]|uniref:Uncharacterized protein n=1 Tax=Helicostylum pulchrum TaxID=562976 RepID=A0ABP9XN83_9FUNG
MSLVTCFTDDIIVQQIYNSKTLIGNKHAKTKKKKKHHNKKKHKTYISTTKSNIYPSKSSRTTLIQTIPLSSLPSSISSTSVVLHIKATPTTIIDSSQPQLSHQPYTSNHRLALGLGLSFGCLSVFILLCLLIYSYQKRKAMYRHTIQPDKGNFFAMPKPILDVVPAVHTKWRPNSLLSAVHLAVSKSPKSKYSGALSESKKESSLPLVQSNK